jgi:hypothetical protein
MPIPSFLVDDYNILKGAAGPVSLVFSVWVWVQKQRADRAEKEKRAKLVLSSDGRRIIDYWPVGGHAKPEGVVSFPFTIENEGNAKAENVIVRIDLPRSAEPRPARIIHRIRNVDGNSEFVTAESKSTHIEFEPMSLLKGGRGNVGTVELSRPVYVESLPREIGVATVNVPTGVHRIDWRIESSAGVVESTDETAIYLNIHAAARGHKPVAWNREAGHDRDSCPECVQLADELANKKNTSIHLRAKKRDHSQTSGAGRDRVPRSGVRVTLDAGWASAGDDR